MRTTIVSGERRRPSQAFILGWPLANLGGVNEVVRNLVREFSTSGDVAPLVVEATDGKAEVNLEGGARVTRISFPLIYDARSPIMTLMRFCIRAPHFFFRFRSLCRQHDVQVLNPHFVSLEHFTLLLFRWFGFFRGRIILSFHGSDIRSMIQSRGMERYLSRVLLRSADLLIPCSRGLGAEILLLVPECGDRINPIPNGIDAARFVSNSASGIKLPESFRTRRQILNIGAFEYKKGHDVLLKAFVTVNKARPETCLVIAGQTRGQFIETSQLVEKLGLKESVLLLQDLPHSEIGALLRDADIFALSSRWEEGVCGEGFAMALLEAAAAAIPVVSTKSCGVAELIEDGVTGTLVAPDCPAELAQALIAMLDNPDEAERQSKNLHAKVTQHFTWTAAHQQYLAIGKRCSSGLAKGMFDSGDGVPVQL